MRTSESSHPLRWCANLLAIKLLYLIGTRSSYLASCHQWDLMNISTGTERERSFFPIRDGSLAKDWVFITKDSLLPRQQCGKGGLTGPFRSTASKEVVSS